MKRILLAYFSFTLCVSLSFSNIVNENHETAQSKRDTSSSFSYAAADINSKEGTRIKTITVIKNTDGKNDKQIKIDPSYHKDEDWSKHIHKNFDAFGKIPDVPDIDELFDFTKNFKVEKSTTVKSVIQDTKKKDTAIENKTESNTKKKPIEASTVENKQVVEKSGTEKSKEGKETKEVKIPDDVELINTEMLSSQKSQSIHYAPSSSKQIKVEKPQNQYLMEYSTPQHKIRQYFIEPSVLRKSASYKRLPNPVYSPASTPSIRKFPISDVLSYPNGIGNNGVTTIPYLAPSSIRISQANFRNQATGKPLRFASSSQSPYIAPSIKKTYALQLTNNKVNDTVISNGNKSQTVKLPDIKNENYNDSRVAPFQTSVNLRIGNAIPYSLTVLNRSRGLRY